MSDGVVDDWAEQCLVGETRVDDRVAGDLAQVGGCQLPHLGSHAVLLHEWFLCQVDLQPPGPDRQKADIKMHCRVAVCFPRLLQPC